MRKTVLFILAVLLGLSLPACSSQTGTIGKGRGEAGESQVSETASVPEREEGESSGIKEMVFVAEQGNGRIQAETEQESGQTEQAGSRIGTLIAYFSLIDIVPEGADAVTHATPSAGNTEAVAMEIQRQTGGELFAIHTVQSYPVIHQECSGIAEEEMREDVRPELSSHVEHMEAYDTVYIGFPIWWYQEPMAIRSFLEEYDFSGKTVIPFCISLGVGIGESEEHIKDLIPEAEVLSGLSLSTGRQDNTSRVEEWLEEIGVK